ARLAEQAHAARQAAEETAREAAETRAAAEQTARDAHQTAEQAIAERMAAERRTAEALQAMTKAREAAAESHRLRAEAEEALAANVINRQAVEASIRHNAELVEHALAERLVAERRAAELAEELVTLRSGVAAALKAKGSKKSVQALEAMLAAASTTTTTTTTTTTASAATPAADPLPSSGATRPAPAPSRTAWTVGRRLEATDPGRSAGSADTSGPRPTSDRAPDQTPDENGEVRSFGTAPEATVTVSAEGIVEIRHGEDDYVYDLYDLGVEVVLRGDPDSPDWRAELGGRDGVIVESADVDAPAFHREVLRWRPDAAR
ncbi:MAG: hypothetical protein QM638_22890, partial [Nocardioides sp.]